VEGNSRRGEKKTPRGGDFFAVEGKWRSGNPFRKSPECCLETPALAAKQKT